MSWILHNKIAAWIGHNVGLLFKALAWLWERLIYSWYYTDQRITSKIEIAPSWTGEGMRLYYSEQKSDVRLWLKVINHTPLNLNIEDVFVDVLVNCKIMSFSHPVDYNVPPHFTGMFYVEWEITKEQVARIAWQLKQPGGPQIGLNLTARIKTAGRSVKWRGNEIMTQGYHLMNFDQLK